MNPTLIPNRSIIIVLTILLSFSHSFSQSIPIPPEVHVILTGNIADLKDPATLLTSIDTYCRQNTSTPIWWILNGDTFSPKAIDNAITTWQQKAIDLLNRYQRLHIVINQGDREWSESSRDGWQRVRHIEKLLRGQTHQRLHVFIDKGCPGPETISLTPYLDAVVINSQWFNHPYKKPAPATDMCPVADTDVFMEEVQNVLDETDNKNLLLLTHYPLESLGNYGGRFPLSAYIFPPLAGNVRVAYHQNIGTDKDITNKHFNDFRLRMLGMLADYSSLVVASGHEQNNTVMKAGRNFFINSGAPQQGSFAAQTKQARLSTSQPGFIEVTYTESGEVSYRLISPDINIAATRQVLINEPCGNTTLTDKNEAYQPCKETITPSEKMSGTYPASIELAAGPEYKAGGLKKKLLGRHYRSSWTTPVKTTYLNLDTTFGGLVVDKIGGGRQTTSLKMAGGNGKEYVFRSVDKDPTKALNYAWRGTLVSQVIKDQTTTQQPYGALTAAHLLNKIHILHATPHLYILPKDDKLGPFKDKYGNLFGLLEDRPNDKIAKDKIFAGATHIEKSYKMFEKLSKDYDNTIDQKEFCRARVFDMFVGDWGKHEDNWKWAGFKTDSGEIFKPIPRDRDHVFSRWDGLLPYLADREWAKPSGENFDYKIKGLNSLMWQARHLDRFATNSLSKADWIKAATDIQHAITDTDVDEAIAQMPHEIYNTDGKEIAAKLKARLEDLPRYAEEYYNMLSREVDITGTNKSEYFHITRHADGSATITVYPLAKNDSIGSLDKILYKRTFQPTETKEIRIFGLSGHDIFNIEGTGREAIFIRIIGGDGEDTINDRSIITGAKHSTWVYDQELATNIRGNGQAVRITPKDEALYYYRRTAFAYNTYFPVALVSYNPFNGFSVSGGVTFKRQRFDKPGFHTIHNIKGSVSTESNYEVSYSNRLRYLIGKWDGTGTILLSRPLNYNYFFGIGNETTYDKSKPANYYRTQYNSFAVTYGLTRDFWKQSNITLTANYEGDKGIPRNNSYLGEHPDIPGMEKVDLLFAKATLSLDFRDNTALPERGFHIYFSQQAGHVSHGNEQVFTISELEAEQYISTRNTNPVTFGLRIGGGRNHGNLPFYKLFSLGQLNDLQGYKRNRFTGESKAFINTELRKQLVQTQNTLIPVRFGIRGFFDMGRVWSDTEKDGHTWHTGYGGGVYVIPFKEQFAINLSVGSSKEESMLIMFTVGSFIK